MIFFQKSFQTNVVIYAKMVFFQHFFQKMRCHTKKWLFFNIFFKKIRCHTQQWLFFIKNFKKIRCHTQKWSFSKKVFEKNVLTHDQRVFSKTFSISSPNLSKLIFYFYSPRHNIIFSHFSFFSHFFDENRQI